MRPGGVLLRPGRVSVSSVSVVSSASSLSGTSGSSVSLDGASDLPLEFGFEFGLLDLVLDELELGFVVFDPLDLVE
jgi:hypothetical protein